MEFVQQKFEHHRKAQVLVVVIAAKMLFWISPLEEIWRNSWVLDKAVKSSLGIRNNVLGEISSDLYRLWQCDIDKSKK